MANGNTETLQSTGSLSGLAVFAPFIGWLIPGGGHLIQKKWLRGFQSKGDDELCVVANFRMDIQRKVRAVERDVVFKGELQLPSERPSHWLQAEPEQPVVHD